ncbi:MAG: T9SS type A sorting domain-containing protein [bacterium]|nr:T9SS type A sorting domain-containing protein [bacterium]
MIRLSTHIFNNEEQIDKLVAALASATGAGSTAVTAENGEQPQAFEVSANYPNPFNANTQIHYELAHSGQIEVTVYNTKGQTIDVLASGWQEAGAHQLTWNAASQATGTYFYEVCAGARRVVRKMVLLK